MPVRVDIPIRIRVDTGAALELQSSIEEALVAAVGRAVKNSRDVVLAARGGFVGVQAQPPELTWGGDGLDQISTEARAELEERIANVVANACREAGIYDFQASGASGVGSGPVEETIDEDRYASLAGLYAVPSYDKGGKKTLLPVVVTEGTIATSPGRPMGVLEWDRILNLDDIIKSYHFEIRRTFRKFPTSGYLGAIYLDADGYMRITVFKYPEGNPEMDAPLKPHPQVIESRATGLKAVTERVDVVFPPNVTYHMSWYGKESGFKENKKILLKFWGDTFRQLLIKDAEKLSESIDTANIDPAVLKAQIENQLDKLIAMEAGNVDSDVDCFILLTFGGQRLLLYSVVPFPSNFSTELLPLVKANPNRQMVGADDTEGRGGQGVDAGEGEKKEGDGEDKSGRAGDGTGEGAGDEEPQRIFPPSRYSVSGGTQDCSPFLGEPSLDKLGEDGEYLRRLISEISFKLQITPCEHAGKFCINAADALNARSAAVSDYAANEEGFSQPTTFGEGNVGLFQFVPVASPGILLMRHLAGVTPSIRVLYHGVSRIYAKPEHRKKIQDLYRDNPHGWANQFNIEFYPRIREAIAVHFGMTCRIVFLQLLRSSRKSIDDRLTKIDVYSRIFEAVIIPQLRRADELISMRNDLKQAEALEQLKSNPYSHANAIPEPENIMRRDGEIYGIRDIDGFVHTMVQLERSIAWRRGMAEEIDPLVKQLVDLPGVVDKVAGDPQAAKTYLRELLTDMQGKNAKVTKDVADDWFYAFQAGQIHKDFKSSNVPKCDYALHGVHLMAHNQVGYFFAGDDFYPAGLNYLFGREMARRSMWEFVEFSGTILLAVLCPPAAFAVGVGLAVYHYTEALEKEQIYESLIDPELIITRAEVEAELFAARLGLALSFIPEAGTIARAGIVGVRAVAKRGVRRGAGLAMNLARRSALQAMRRSLARGLIVAFAREVATDHFMNAFIEKIMADILKDIQREMSITGPVGGLAGAEQTSRMLDAEQVNASRARDLDSSSQRGGR